MSARLMILVMLSTCFFVGTSSLENIPDNGWRPMSNERVAELRNFIKNPRNAEISVHPDMFQRRKIKIQRNESKQSRKDESNFSLWSQETKNHSKDFPSNKADTLDIQGNVDTRQLSRKAKKIDHPYTLSNQNFNEENNKRPVKTNFNVNHSNINYEVTENIEENKNEVSVTERSTGYVYEKPKLEAEVRNSLTKNLFSILANYNIRSSDKLPNYNLSLRQNSRNSDRVIYMHVPVALPLKYNSPDHLPIDSILAVFLSNYGHYLPGLYGFKRNYNNLYGYLASNNIHNNKPFGAYKVFSDTDSSHRR